MTDKSFGIFDQNSGATKNVDVTELSRADGTAVERQRVVIGHDSRPQVKLDPMALHVAADVALFNTEGQRHELAARMSFRTGFRGQYGADRRGHGFQRGSVR